MKVTCIVPSAGKGKRLRSKQAKPFVRVAGIPILARTLKVLAKCTFIDDVIVVVSPARVKACKRLVKKYRLTKVTAVIRGGEKRFDSVKNGLAKIQNPDFIIIHDGARPFVDKRILGKVFMAARKYGAAVLARPAKQTLKLVDKNIFIVKTPKRKFLWEAETPQIFKKDLIVKAYKKSKDRNATDDASLVERMGHKVKIVKGSPGNIKITTPQDLKLANIICG